MGFRLLEELKGVLRFGVCVYERVCWHKKASLMACGMGKTAFDLAACRSAISRKAEEEGGGGTHLFLCALVVLPLTTYRFGLHYPTGMAMYTSEL